MAENASYEMLSRQTVTASQTGKVEDMGGHNVLQIMLAKHVARSAGNLILRHGATNDPASMIDLISMPLTSAVPIIFSTQANSTRFVQWYTDANVAGGPPIVTLTVIGKSA